MFNNPLGVMTPLTFGVKYLFSPESTSTFMLFMNHYTCCKNFPKLIHRPFRDPWYADELSVICKCGGKNSPNDCINTMLLDLWLCYSKQGLLISKIVIMWELVRNAVTPPHTHWGASCLIKASRGLCVHITDCTQTGQRTKCVCL